MARKIDYIGDKVLVPIAAATAGGVAANQFPQNKKSSKKAIKDISKGVPKGAESSSSIYAHARTMANKNGRKASKLLARRDLDGALEAGRQGALYSATAKGHLPGGKNKLVRTTEITVKKNLTPIIKSDDPDFNHVAAQKAAQMVMDMEDGEAQLFVKMVMAEVMDNEITKNERTLQRHLDEVVEKRIERFKKAALSAISKGHTAEALEFAEVVAEMEEVIKAAKNPYEFGFYEFEESDFRRDPRTGRFMTKVSQTQRRKPLGDKQAKNLGIRTDKAEYKDLTNRQKAEFQHEWMQVANFLNAAQMSGGSGAKIRLQVDDGSRKYWTEINGKPKPGDWDKKAGEKVIAVEAIPEGGLTLGGASYSLVNGIGSQNAQRINTLDAKGRSFADDWSSDDFDPRNSNARLYHRTKTGSQLIMDMTDERSKTHAAARFGRAVGEHGQSAEKVFGPPTRKAMYRYRGTEKTPEAEVTREYSLATQRANQPGVDIAQRGKERAAITRARNAYRKQKAQEHNADPANKSKPLDMNAIKIPREIDAQILAAAKKQASAVESAPLSDDAKGAGREVLVRHLMDRERAPDKNLYNLQLESGVTPPSEGFILDKDGKILTQASGYGDDHYLPFNLKNLKGLRGGEYIRTRSVGGPTSEDIYTGLMAGAKQVTVVSRSGTFTVEFEQDFHGKRRYNDKAFRMVRRYEKLLDTVQSETVERNVQIDPAIRQIITRQVRDEGFDRNEIRGEVKNRIQEYKDELNSITDEGELREFVEEFIGARVDAAGSDMSTEERNRLAGQLRNDWQSQNEYKFRLNGRGYADAMSALQEQFPYYFKTRYQPTREMERIETEKDKGYVEPGRNRPTAARAGQFGTKVNQGEKFSASHADYQRTRGQRGSAKTADARRQQGGDEAAPSENQNGSVTAKTEKDKEKLKQKKNEIQHKSVAVKLHQEIAASGFEDLDKIKIDGQKIFDLNESEAREFLSDPANRKKFGEVVDRFKKQFRDAESIDNKVLRDYFAARSNTDRQKYDPERAFDSKVEFEFSGKAFEEGKENEKFRGTAANQIDKRTPPLSADVKLSQMSISELRDEIEMCAQIYPVVRDGGEPAEVSGELKDVWDIRASRAARVNTKDKLDKHIEDVHKMIRLKELGGIEAEEKKPQPKSEVSLEPVESEAETPVARLTEKQHKNKRQLEKLMDAYNKAAQFYDKRHGMGKREEMMDAAADKIGAALEAGFLEDDDIERLMSDLGSDSTKWLNYALENWKTRGPERT
jgi:hypothetical protein